MTAARRRVWIDTDTASDDAVALMMALRSTEVEVVGISVVAGNVGLEQAVSNALYTVELCGSDVPVYAGAAKPMVRELEKADWFHGRDGLGDLGFRPGKRKAEDDAAGALARAAQTAGPLELITLGPLTNMALALQRDPKLRDGIGRCVVMGGAPCCEGNVTPAAEFNIWVDPEAARAVFSAGMRVEMVGWQLARGSAVADDGDMERLRMMDTPWSRFALDSNRVAIEAYRLQTGERGISLPDPVAMAILLEPQLCLSSSEHLVAIETTSELTRGMTVVDRLHVARDARNRDVWAALLGKSEASVCWELDVAGWKKLLFDSLA